MRKEFSKEALFLSPKFRTRTLNYNEERAKLLIYLDVVQNIYFFLRVMKFIWHKKNNFLSLNPITQVYGVCFDASGNVLIMRTSGKSWNIPGGTPESNETPELTLKRELEEEVDVSVSLSEMIGYFEVVSDKPTIYQLRYAALIDKVNPQTVDPATNEVNERKFIKPNEFFEYIEYDEYRLMLDEAVKWYEKNKSIT